MPNVDEIFRKYGAKIEEQVKTDAVKNVNYSREYVQFKAEMASELTRFERWCRSLGSFIRLKIASKDEARIRKDLEIAHADVEPSQVVAFGVMAFSVVFLLGLLFSVAVALISETEAEGITGLFEGFPLLFFVLMIVLALFLFYFINTYPNRLANKWRLKASSQMVPAILYIVVYMRHTPNLEKAVAFASENLQPPLALDFKKIFYDVSVGKFSTIKESLDNYLEIWRDYAPSFIESFHLIESSLFEPDDARRIIVLEKSLQVVLDGVYDKMLKFVHEIKSPIQNAYMFGTLLPVLGIALLPLVSAMIGDYILWYHVFILYNLIIPFLAFFLMNKYMMLRPGGYGETSLLERNPHYPKYKSKKPYVTAGLICVPLILFGLLPLIFQYTPIPSWIGLEKDYALADIGLGLFGDGMFFDYKDNGAGPFGIGALLFGLFIPLGVALFFSMSAKLRTTDLMKERDKTRQLESEFNNSLFQLGNRIGNGIPPELAFGKVAESSKGLTTADFFRRVHYNVSQMGMSVDKAIFDNRRGAIIYYPSDLISMSMRLLVESAKKGLNVAAMSLMNISLYVKNISKITQRLKDMLAEIVSDISSNMTFLAPLLSGVVVGLAMMITGILNQLDFAKTLGDTGSIGNLDSLVGAEGIFQVAKIIPPYYLQIIIGLYLVQIIFILTGTLVTINSGEDKLEKTNKIGKNLKTGILFYTIVALVSTLALFLLTSLVLGGLG